MNVIFREEAYKAPYRFAVADESAPPAEYPKQFIQSLGLIEAPPKRKIGFWRRQFHPEVTRGQRKFDWTFGVILPVICFFFDPIVFRTGTGDGGLLGRFLPFAYFLSYSAIMATIAWLLWGDRLKGATVILSGLFAVSAFAAFIIGVFLAPFSLLGLLIVIGALGFTPLFSSFVFLRNSVRTFRVARATLEPDFLFASFSLTALASAVIPYLINHRWFI